MKNTESNNGLAQKMRTLLNVRRESEILLLKKESNVKEQSDLEKQFAECKSKSKIWGAAIAPVIAIALIIALIVDQPSGDSWIICVLLALLIPIDIFIVLPILIKRRSAQITKLEEKQNKCANEIKSIDERLKSLMSEVDLRLVPEKYFVDEAALEFLTECVEMGRALTVGEAINLYEETEHRKRVESLMQEQIDSNLNKKDDDDDENVAEKEDSSGSGALKGAVVIGALLAVAAFLKRDD